MKKIIKKIIPDFWWHKLRLFRERVRNRRSAKSFLKKIKEQGSPILTFEDKQIIDKFPDEQFKSVLEVGPGGGRLIFWFAYQGYQTKGVKPDSWYRSLINCFMDKMKLTNCVVVDGDIHQLPFPNNTFDVVVSSEVLEHVKDPKQGISECVRVARKKAIFTTPVGHCFDSPSHLHHFDNDDIENLFEEYKHSVSRIYTKEKDKSSGQRKFLISVYI